MAKRDLSASHSSFTSSLMRGSTRNTSAPRVSMRIEAPTASITSTLSVFFSSHGRVTNEYGFDVRAPTGQMSMRLPDSSDVSACST